MDYSQALDSVSYYENRIEKADQRIEELERELDYQLVWRDVAIDLPPEGRVTRCLITLFYDLAVEKRHKYQVCAGEYDPWSKSWAWPSTTTGSIYGEDGYYKVTHWMEMPVPPQLRKAREE